MDAAIYSGGGGEGEFQGWKEEEEEEGDSRASTKEETIIKGHRHTQTKILDSVSDLPNVQGKKVPGKTLGTRPYGRIYAVRHVYGR